MASFAEAAGSDPGRLRIGWSVTVGVRPDPLHVRAVEDTARLLADLGHDVQQVDPHHPDPTPAFVPQFFAGIRDEAHLVEHDDRLERRTRQTCRMGLTLLSLSGQLERARPCSLVAGGEGRAP